MGSMRWAVASVGTLTGKQTGSTVPAGGARRRLVLVLGPSLAAFLALGLLGLWRYVEGHWLHRGYPPPRDPAFVTEDGQESSPPQGGAIPSSTSCTALRAGRTRSCSPYAWA